MPGDMDGVDLARIVRERWPWIGIVLATGYSAAVTEANDEGFAVLRKPYVPEAVGRARVCLAAGTCLWLRVGAGSRQPRIP